MRCRDRNTHRLGNRDSKTEIRDALQTEPRGWRQACVRAVVLENRGWVWGWDRSLIGCVALVEVTWPPLASASFSDILLHTSVEKVTMDILGRSRL